MSEPVVAQWIVDLLANTEYPGLISAAARLSHKLATCPCKKTQQLKRRLDALCTSNGSLEPLPFILIVTFTLIATYRAFEPIE